MKYKLLSVKLPSDLRDALGIYAKENFNGNVSDATRFLLVNILADTNNPSLTAVRAVYFNLHPKLMTNMMTMTNRLEKQFSIGMQKILNSV